MDVKLDLQNKEIIEKLKGYSTPTVANVVATYPEDPHCLGLYDPWKDKWYTDQSVHCIFPEMGIRIGYAFTMVVSIPDSDEQSSYSFTNLIEPLFKAKKPTIVVCQQKYPTKILNRARLFGGQITALFKACKVEGVITNGPSGDIDEMRPLGVQYIMSGVTPGHGDFTIRGINMPVSVAGMDVKPHDIIHMDEHGAVKFPADQLKEVYKNICFMVREEKKQSNALLAAKTLEEIKRAWSKY
jgi:regulator of RNase E activity RraA